MTTAVLYAPRDLRSPMRPASSSNAVGRRGPRPDSVGRSSGTWS